MKGVILVDKPEDWSSREVVNYIQDVLGINKAGHAGTLDPLATGLLVVCLNEATKLIPFLVEGDKEYLVRMMLGLRTDTLDRQGRVMERVEPHVEEGSIAETLKGLCGRMTQTPPYYSAVKYRGKPLYKWARQGINIDAEPREIEIKAIELKEVDYPYVTFSVSCSKGTYVRSLCATVGDRLGCGACLWSLRRLKSGNFSLEEAVSLTGKGDDGELLARSVISMTDALPNLPTIEVDEDFAASLKEGRQPLAADLRDLYIPLFAAGGVVKFVKEGKSLVALARTMVSSEEISRLAEERQVARILRVFHE